MASTRSKAVLDALKEWSDSFEVVCDTPAEDGLIRDTSQLQQYYRQQGRRLVVKAPIGGNANGD